MSLDPHLGAQLLAFLALAAVPTFTPGAEMALVTRNALVYGRSTASWTIVGSLLGPMIHGLVFAVGLSALVAQSATAYGTLKLLGACYLAYLGVRMTFRSLGGRGGMEEVRQTEVREISSRYGFGQGLLTNILNPKPALFYLTVLPQFVAPTDPVVAKSMLLAASHVALKLVWFSAYTYVLLRTARAFSRSRLWSRLEAAAGALLVAFGIRLALSSRP